MPFRVGMISPPSWFNCCAAELESIRPDAVRVMNTQLMTESVRRCCERAPDAQAVLLAGMLCPQLHVIAELDAVAGRPIVSFPAVYVRVLNRLGLTGDPALGRTFALAA